MLVAIALFELRSRLRMLSTYVYFAVFFGLSFLWTSMAAGAFPNAAVEFGGGGKVTANAPLSIAFMMVVLGLLATIVVAAVSGRATFQDIDHRTTALFFTKPISKLDYLGGRYLGAIGTMLLIYPALSLGCLVAVHTPYADVTRVGHDTLVGYLSPYLVIVLPNLFFTSAIFFSLAALTRRMLPVYVGGVVLVLGYLISLTLTNNVENRTAGAILDPFGLEAVSKAVEYWSVAERNVKVLPFGGIVLLNRLLWTAIGAGLLLFTYARFTFSSPNEGGASKGVAGETLPLGYRPTPLGAAQLDYGGRAAFRAFASLTRLQLRETVKNPFFLVLVLAGVLFVVFGGMQVDEMFGTKVYPVTSEILSALGGMFTLFLLIIIAFYSGELVWRERDAGIDQIVDALPIKRGVLFYSKLCALMLVQVILLAVLVLACASLQMAKGYFHFEPDVYLKTIVGIRLPALLWLSCLAMFVHVLVNNKYVGHFLMILYFLFGMALPQLGYERYIYRPFRAPPAPYSAMNGFGHFVFRLLTFQTYWWALAALLALIASAFWVRGTDTAFKNRAALARASFTRRTAALAAVCATVFLASGLFIQWNTDHKNRYRDTNDTDRDTAEYEKRYKRWEETPQPTIKAVTIAADIFPETRQLRLHGTYALLNQSGLPLSLVVVRIPEEATIRELSFGRGETLKESDPRLYFYLYSFPSPLAPGDTLTLSFDLTYDHTAFPSSETDTHVVSNGTFVNSSMAPGLGYEAAAELTADAKRHKYGLAPRVARPLGDTWGTAHNALSPDSDWIDFDATVSTSNDQLAIAPGYLEREWQEGGRRFFHYTMDSKILGFYSFLSARYEVLKETWTPPPGAMPGSREVAIEIDYQKGHAYNLPRMTKGIRRALDYYTTNFGPYQHRQARIVEFPGYERFAESFPNTIPFSESIGFIARVDDKNPDDIDYPFYITAHEIAHQWWGHQVIGARVEGAAMLIESMSQYSALMVMKKEYGGEKMKKFLRYELDRYLRGRSNARHEERPLERVEDDPDVHYAKGSLVLYALADYIGEDVLNGALSKFIGAHRFEGAPYTDSRALVEAIREVTPASYEHLIEDLFETITLYENRAIHATKESRGGGVYDVTIDVESTKFRAGADGAETEIPIADFIDIGVVGEKGKFLALERRRIDTRTSRFTLTVNEPPVKAGIDPLNKLIDRLPDDNLVRVE